MVAVDRSSLLHTTSSTAPARILLLSAPALTGGETWMGGGGTPRRGNVSFAPELRVALSLLKARSSEEMSQARSSGRGIGGARGKNGARGGAGRGGGAAAAEPAGHGVRVGRVRPRRTPADRRKVQPLELGNVSQYPWPIPFASNLP